MRDIRRIPLEEAQARLLDAVSPLERTEIVPPAHTLGRVAFRDECAVFDIPPFERSPLDGYAVNHLDLAGASEARPARLRVAGCVFAGDVWPERLERGCAVRLMTGLPIPAGATCVVRQEDTDEGSEFVLVRVSHAEHDNYCFRGEDVRKGDALVRRGERLTAGHAGLVAGQGLAGIEVFGRPRAGILSTGSELSPAGEALAPGRIFDSNGAFMSALCAAAHADASPARRVRDDPAALAETLAELLTQNDVVITTGGVSVGERDCMPEVAERLGAKVLFHGVAVRPGSPAMALEKDGKPVICLSGNPFAAFVTFRVLAAPALARLGGVRDALPARVRAVVAGTFAKGGGVRRLVPARLEGGSVFFPDGGRASRSLPLLARCDCLVDIPAGTTGLRAGDAAEVILP